MISKRRVLLGLVAAAATGVLLAEPATAQSAPTTVRVQAAAPSSGTSFGLAEQADPAMIVLQRHHRRHHRRRHHRRRHHWRHWRHHRRHHGRHHRRHHWRRHHSHHSISNSNRNTNVNRISIRNENVNIND